jgi:hypothetical protein
VNENSATAPAEPPANMAVPLALTTAASTARRPRPSHRFGGYRDRLPPSPVQHPASDLRADRRRDRTGWHRLLRAAHDAMYRRRARTAIAGNTAVAHGQALMG